MPLHDLLAKVPRQAWIGPLRSQDFRGPILVTRVTTLFLELEITVNLIKTELTEDKQGLGAQRKTKLPTP